MNSLRIEGLRMRFDAAIHGGTRGLGITVALLFFSVMTRGADSQVHTQPDLVLVVTDDQRPDTIHALGNSRIRTPSLDRLVRSGVTFRRAYTGYPICYASRAQLLTGCNVFTALRDYPRSQVRDSLATLAGTLGKAGYTTVYSGKWHNDGNPLTRGYQQVAGLYSAGGAKHIVMPSVDQRGMPLTGYRGWTFKDSQNQPRLELGVGLRPDNSEIIGQEVVRVIDEAEPSDPLFLHVNFAFPHDPRQWPESMPNAYSPEECSLPSNFRTDHGFDHGNEGGRDEVLLPRPLKPLQVQAELALYYAMISDVDQQVGRIIKALERTGRLQNTVFIFTSDQGLALGSHGLLGKQNQYEHSIRSPLIVAGPRGLVGSGLAIDESLVASSEILVGREVDALVELSDLFPTLCDFAGVPVPATVEGASLLPVLTGKETRVHDVVYGVFTDTQRMICDDRWKFIFYPKVGRQQLFDLREDPHELVNRVDDPDCQNHRVRLQRQLDTWRLKSKDPLLPRSTR